MAGFGWRIARRSGSATAQLPLAICGVLAVVIVLLGKAEASLFDAARARISDWTAPMLAELRSPLATFERWVGGVGAIFSVHDQNVALKRENAELRKWQNVALSLERRLQRYELLLKAVPDAEIPSRTARVIGESSRPFIRTMMLNVGTSGGVRKGQAVVDDRGFLGRVYLAGERTAWIILLTDLNSRVPVRIVPSNRRAIMAGDNSPSPHLELDVSDAPIREGDRVVSTGDGGLLPPDLPIGVVAQEGSSLRVALFADPDLSDFVQVLDYRLPADPPNDGTEAPPVAMHAPAHEDTGDLEGAVPHQQPESPVRGPQPEAALKTPRQAQPRASVAPNTSENVASAAAPQQNR